MLFRQIKYFLTIADSGSFSEAAAQCFISQSAVSQQISALETELGVQLLERTPRGVILTEAGRYLYEHGKHLLCEAEKLKQGVQAAAYKSEERFSVAYLTGSAPEYLPRALCAFKKQHKDISVEVYGTVINSVISNSVVIEEGAIVRDSVIFTNSVIKKNAIVEFSIIDEFTEVGEGAVVGAGNKKQDNDITVIARNEKIPAKSVIEAGTMYDTLSGGAK